jgi:ribosomal protein S18 acetylase RimI-like enzyme
MISGASYRLVPFDQSGNALCGELAVLHAELLAHSPVALLGADFLRRFYYRVLPRMGLIFGQVAFVDGRPAGFIVATHDASGFMRKALRRHFLRIGLVLAASVLRDPRRLGAIWEGLQILRGLPPQAPRQPQGEILSMGVLPEFRRREFLVRTRLRIGQDLLAAVLKQVAAHGVGRIRVIVDADNLEARLFYSGQGWVPGLARVPGWRKETVEFLWQGPDSSRAHADHHSWG